MRSNHKLTSFSKDDIPVVGETSVLLEIAGVKATHSCIVVPGELIDHDLLLGADFLTVHDITLQLGQGIVRSKFGETRCIETPATLNRKVKIRMAESTIVPPSTVMFVKTKLTHNLRGTHTGLVEPYTNLLLDNGILVSSCIANSSDRMLPVKLVNVSNEPFTLHKQKLLGFMSPIDVIEDNRHLEGISVQKITQENIQEDDSDSLQPAANTSARPEWTKEKLYEELKLDKIVMTPEDLQQLKDTIWQFRDCFSRGDWDLGDCKTFRATIQLKEGATPVWTPSRPVAYKLRGEMTKQLNNLLEAGVIEKCTDSRWNSQVFLTPKPNKPGCFRFVADMRGLNTMTLPDKYELPNINHVVDKIGLCKYFSVFDMSQSFHQVRYDAKSSPYTAFSVENKRYWFLRMVMGHRNSSAQFSRLMDRLLSTVEIRELIYFLDDILLASADVSSHLVKLRIVLQKFREANLKLTPSKTELLKHEVKFVGLTVSSAGLKINKDRVKAVLELKPPANVKQLQSLMGFFGYNRAFIQNYAATAKPLYDLLRKNSKFNWDQTCQRSFEMLKQKIADDVTLTIPEIDDPHNSFQVTLDASKDGFGAHLSQLRNGKRKICAFYSKSVPRHKRSWGATKLEFMCMYHALQHWKIYLKGTKFEVLTDCASLLHRNNIWSNADANMIRKFHKLDQLDFTIRHVSGSSNHISDFLSRYPHKISTRQTGTQTEDIHKPINTESDLNEEHRVEEPTAPGQLVSSVNSTSIDTNEGQDTVIPVYLFNNDENSDLSPENVDVTLISRSSVDQDSEQVEICICEGNQAQNRELETLQSRLFPDGMSEENTVAVSAIIDSTIQSVPDLDLIKQHQEKDLILREVRKWLVKGERPETIQAIRTPPDLIRYWRMFDQLMLREQVIYKKWISCSADINGNLSTDCERHLIVIPEDLKEQTMALTHGTLANLHPGIEESVRRCQRIYYWPDMKKDFKLYVEACTTCGKAKQPTKYLKAPLLHIVVSDFNMTLVIDHIVPERDVATPRRNRYILTITDLFSGYLIAKPTKTQEASESYKIIMREWILRFGFPLEIIFDNAPGFKSEFFQLAFRSLGCKMTPGLPYSCASTSKAERSNKRINTALRVTLSEEQMRDWDLYLDYVTYGLNSMKSRHTGVSANVIVFGKETRTPLSLTVRNEDPELGVYKNKSHAQVARLKHKLIKSIINKARVHAQRDFLYADNTYNRNITGPFFKAGDFCYLLVDCPVHKFQKKWRGPYKILKAINQHLYSVQVGDNVKTCNITKMKRYRKNRYSPESTTNGSETVETNDSDLTLIPPVSPTGETTEQCTRPKRISKPPDRYQG